MSTVWFAILAVEALALVLAMAWWKGRSRVH